MVMTWKTGIQNRAGWTQAKWNDDLLASINDVFTHVPFGTLASISIVGAKPSSFSKSKSLVHEPLDSNQSTITPTRDIPSIHFDEGI